jgi:protein-tyrosine phosphatase
MVKLLFVCHANLCRSPMAEAIMKSMVAEAGLGDNITVGSAGTHCGLAGEDAYFRVIDTLGRYGLKSASLARQLEYEDLNAFDYLFAMDRRNLSFMLRHSSGCRAQISLFLEEAQRTGMISRDEVVDPFPNGDYEGPIGLSTLVVPLY